MSFFWMLSVATTIQKVIENVVETRGGAKGKEHDDRPNDGILIEEMLENRRGAKTKRFFIHCCVRNKASKEEGMRSRK